MFVYFLRSHIIHLLKVLPPPLKVLHDEIAVVFVANEENPVTLEIL